MTSIVKGAIILFTSLWLGFYLHSLLPPQSWMDVPLVSTIVIFTIVGGFMAVHGAISKYEDSQTKKRRTYT